MIPCDVSHPYFDGKTCIDCPINRNVSDIANHKPYFNLMTLQCENCLKYDTNTHKCGDSVTPAMICSAGQVLIKATNECRQLVSNVTAIS